MSPRAIDRFFRTLAREFSGSLTVIVTGAAAGSLWGYVRPSQDIDFGVRLSRHDQDAWERFQAAVDRTVQQTGIQVNYAEDIDRWGSITLLDYRRHTVPYRRFGRLSVRLLDPVYWSIGKLGRYFELDVNDVVKVLRRQRVPESSALRLWGRVLRASPRSTAVTQFRFQVEHFLRTHGRTIWGGAFDPESAIRRFQHAAGIHPTRKRPGRHAVER
jgi:hypothetical protein